MEELVIAKAAAYIGAAFVMAIGSISPAYGQGLVCAKACESIGKYPESAGNIKNSMLLGMGLIETSAIYAFVIALLLIFLV